MITLYEALAGSSLQYESILDKKNKKDTATGSLGAFRAKIDDFCTNKGKLTARAQEYRDMQFNLVGKTIEVNAGNDYIGKAVFRSMMEFGYKAIKGYASSFIIPNITSNITFDIETPNPATLEVFKSGVDVRKCEFIYPIDFYVGGSKYDGNPIHISDTIFRNNFKISNQMHSPFMVSLSGNKYYGNVNIGMAPGSHTNALKANIKELRKGGNEIDWEKVIGGKPMNGCTTIWVYGYIGRNNNIILLATKDPNVDFGWMKFAEKFTVKSIKGWHVRAWNFHGYSRDPQDLLA